MNACACERAFPPREFESASEADSWLSKVRLSPVFRFLSLDRGGAPRERFRCAACGREWRCVVPPKPPLVWGPRAEPAREDQVPAHRHEVADERGLVRASLRWCTVLFQPADGDDVPAVARSLLDWWPGLRRWSETGGFREIELELGPRLPDGWPVSRQFSGLFHPRDIDPAWKNLKSASTWRRAWLRAIRSRRQGDLFRGEEALVVLDLKAESVVAWVLRERP